MDQFLSCDWGTSSFRLRLVQVEGLVLLEEEKNSGGIAEAFKRWKDESGKENERLSFYQAHLASEIAKLERKAGQAVKGLPLIISGMISSTIGMKELPYKTLPFNTDGSNISLATIPVSKQLTNETLIIPGVSSDDDVMRGEETILVGCDAEEKDEAAIYIFPGTHSKHIFVQKGIATSFKTFMTGEFFDLLSSKSILANSIEETNIEDEVRNTHFEEGFNKGLQDNLLNASFHIRTNQLFKKNSPKENYEHLSGLLIGHELKELQQTPPHAIYLVCGQHLKHRYWQGLQLLGLSSTIKYLDADVALIRGQWKILKAGRTNPI